MSGLINFMQVFGGVVDDRFILTVKSDNAGTSATNQFTIPTTGTGYNYTVETSDGYSASGITGNHTITFPSGAGTYDVFISGDFPIIFFNNGGDRLKILDIKNFGFYSDSNTQDLSFYGCTNLLITAPDLGDFSLVTSFSNTWRNCTSLTSFPLIDTSSATFISRAWQGCNNLTSFPLLNTSIVNNFSFAWNICNSLTSFPLINTASGTNFASAWNSCNSLTSFPLIDTSSGTNFQSAWQNCSSLTSFPANMFDGCNATNFLNAFLNTALTEASIDGILVSINSNGTSGGTFNQSGGIAPSIATGRPAIDALRARGWTIAVTGGY